ncbi:hypothetical protein ASPBRDRAFT_527757 [Aspergillus brasiliensis CBS 101740]|uniref:Uncharacterized protein n=1 Tax=Aspergillus brasiliensis (strain CBS 101740 / IMI 381727 / IBT 21946) TaxID=767769 RepID=A0A1L9UQV0_ASPBC|nr:hypothetical protein ASPBRDRAFT_527757 [Aspergillus brasiliensis CBS 101740]
MLRFLGFSWVMVFARLYGRGLVSELVVAYVADWASPRMVADLMRLSCGSCYQYSSPPGYMPRLQ